MMGTTKLERTIMNEELDQIQAEVKEWALRNFGQQISKVDPTLKLGSLNPLLGMVEEVGEFFSSTTEDDAVDALSDITIYLADYCWREDIKLSELYLSEKPDLVYSLYVVMGKLSHITLKRHQGIRGYDNIDKYRKEQGELLTNLVAELKDLALDYGDKKPLIDIMRETWEKVKQRNWIKNKEKAHVQDNFGHSLPTDTTNDYCC